jgi:hypothetical protein
MAFSICTSVCAEGLPLVRDRAPEATAFALGFFAVDAGLPAGCARLKPAKAARRARTGTYR